MPKGKDKDASPKNSVDRNLGINIGGEMYYPLAIASAINPCAGKADGTTCGAGCVCRSGQCYYTLFRLEQMGFTISE
jgi:hypothetical protein